jgi:hypothetical protein
MDAQILLQLGSVFGSATALFAWHKLYARVVFTRLKTTNLRRKRWNKLLQNNRWRAVNPLVLEDVFVEAHGYSLSDRDIRFALGRSNTRSLLRELRQSKGMVRLKADESCYEHWRGLKVKKWSYHAHSVTAFVLGYLPLTVLFLGAPVIGKHMPAGAQIVLLVMTFAVLIMGLFIASWFEAAHRVVEEVDERFPRWVSVRSSKGPAANDNKAAASVLVAHSSDEVA